MNKFIGKITSIIFVVNDLFVLKCKVFVLYDDMKAEYIGQVQPQPYQYEGEYVYTDADDKPRFKVKGFGIAENYRNKTFGHGTAHVISLMHDFANDFSNKINELQSLAARPIENIKSVLEGTEFYCADPLTAYVTYKPNLENTGEQKKIRLCGCKEPCFEIGEKRGYLECVMCKHLTEKEDGAGNGLITFCKKFSTPVETYDTKGQYDLLMHKRKQTKDRLCELADFIASRAENLSTEQFMTHFKQIKTDHKQFDDLCTMFRHGVHLALRIEEFNDADKLNELLTIMDIELDGTKVLGKDSQITINRDISIPNRCDRCLIKSSCKTYKFVEENGYTVQDCDERMNSEEEIYKSLLHELSENGIQFADHNDKTTVTFTKFGRIELIYPERYHISNLYKILDRYRKYFYFREAISDDGCVCVWTYNSKKSYRDHVNHILNTCKQRKEKDDE